MCPVFDYNNNYCKVSPSHSTALIDQSEADYKCKDSYNYKNCGNYQSYERGDYKIER